MCQANQTHGLRAICLAIAMLASAGPIGVAEATDEAKPGDAVRAVKDVPPELRQEQYWQRGPYCGANCLYVLLKYHQYRVDHGDLVKDLNPPPRGNSMEELRREAERYGLSLVPAKVTPERLNDVEKPFIVHLNGSNGRLDHFSLVLAVDERGVEILDEVGGSSFHMPQESFYRMWSGYVMVTERRNYALYSLLSLGLSSLLAFSVARGPSPDRRSDESRART